MTDPQHIEMDLDGDGTTDAWSVDADGDGVDESWAVDADGDGVPEEIHTLDGVYHDLDGDGYAETFETVDELGNPVVEIDAEGDGIVEVVAVDADGDGVIDTAYLDGDQDGLVDEIQYDLDGDGTADVIEVAGQTLYLDDDGQIVDQEAAPPIGTPIDIADGETVPAEDTEPTDDADDTDVDPTDTTDVDPADTVPAADPADEAPTSDEAEREADAERWFEQSENGYCMPASVAQVVSEHLDADVTEEEFVQRAIDLGYLTWDDELGWSGMTVDQGAELMESFGVEATVTTGDVESLDEQLDQGYDVVVAIDSSVVWEGSDADVADHAVVVSSIEDGMVYLNDPGTPDGELEAITVEEFEEAWSASGNAMIITDAPDGAEDGTLAAANPGTIILPITLGGGADADVIA